MKQISGKEFCKALERNGWSLLRVNGSHHIYGRVDRLERISVPVHAGRPLARGLLAHFMKTAGLTHGDL